jgi:hypothetical protein
MPRLRSASWLWAFVVVLGAWYAPGGQGQVWPPAAAVRPVSAVDLPREYVRVTPATPLAIDARLRPDAGPECRVGPHPTVVAIPAAVGRRRLDTDPVTAGEHRGQSCHFPLFPTGPPFPA